MGRELKRVPMNFGHPIGEAWPGYLNQHYVKCPDCDGKGSTQARLLFDHIIGELMFAPSRRANAAFADELHQVTAGLAGRPGHGLIGHDSSDQWAAGKKILLAAGLDPDTWGWCQRCKGEGIHPDHAAAYESWTRTEPPTGEGYQLWETTSEGSPISPVFPTLDQLCAWAEENATTFGSSKASADRWREMLSDGIVYHQEGRAIFI